MGIRPGNHGLDHLLLKAAPMLETLQDPDTLSLMAQYGDVTVISIIKNASGGNGTCLLAKQAGPMDV